ncbi:uncharacterized protein MT2654 [Folsomia candida]|uniref:Purple acid phosphatase 18 n=1 Tax=Folsomia candida TaxID=158441 RepID=A0A226EST4_FOLCA|nr:uncharacterized protein MT2654 [Folsomia candida]OXA60673.1 Purple acid phosphatase 18 [Folsomia candida]
MLTIGVIGDFGVISPDSLRVSRLVKSWNPTVIITTGDNIYSPPTPKNYSSVVGVLYREYLCAQEKKRTKPGKLLVLRDSECTELSTLPKKCNTKFLPCVGNHDYPFPGYMKYFQLPTYYSAEFIKPTDFLKIISLNNYGDLHGRFDDKISEQRTWLEKELDSSAHIKWIIITFHYPQQCSNNSDEENEYYLKRCFPFHKYKNVALILSGHQHIYERVEFNNVTNVVVGTSGSTVRRKSKVVIEQSKFLDDSGFGALRLEIGEEEIHGFYYALEYVDGQHRDVLKDQFCINKS